jgi:putative resolvase
MKLSEWAKQQGISYRTAWRWLHAGTLPVPAKQLPSGTILVEVPRQPTKQAAVYARVATERQRYDLDRPVSRLAQAASASGLALGAIVSEVATSLQTRQRKLLQLRGNPNIQTILVEHKDRITRFGFELVEAALHAQSRKIVALEDRARAEDLLVDLEDALRLVCELAGKRPTKRPLQRALKAILE